MLATRRKPISEEQLKRYELRAALKMYRGYVCSLLELDFSDRIKSVRDAELLVEEAKRVEGHFGQCIIVALHPTDRDTFTVGTGAPNPRIKFFEGAGFKQIHEFPNGHWQSRNVGGTMVILARNVWDEDKKNISDGHAIGATAANAHGNKAGVRQS